MSIDAALCVGKKVVSRVPARDLALLIVVGGFLWFIAVQNRAASEFVERQTQIVVSQQDKVFEKMAHALEKMADATDKNTHATVELNSRLMTYIQVRAERNGIWPAPNLAKGGKPEYTGVPQ